MDALAARLMARRPRFFEDGWGAQSLLERLTRSPQGFALPELQEVILSAPRREGRILVQEGRFPSPAAVGPLPASCAEARFQLLLPADAGPRPPVCLFLASSGDHGFGMRRFLTKPLLAQGVGAVLLENPYYGSRRPPGQQDEALRTVVDLLLMFRATAVEAVALLGWLLARGHPKVGISGYSMGGSMAAYAASLFPLPLAVIPLAVAHSAAPVFTQGVLSAVPDWEALGRDFGGPEAARKRLAEFLEPLSITQLPPLPNPRRAIIVAARKDGFVPSASTLRVLQHWRGAELRYVSGGHVSGLVTGRRVITRAILDAFSRIEAIELPPEAG
ncbi:alpha/beta hydrolase family protein [Hyalangium rubrum]|uniref:Alpha/beta hydrolase family protein n=1 Tax=Hyalangium rubrum TaxID=3103134 RepID=A0ABU5GXY6_9BACT|nr:alpha/beta hydrolase family protein [Hyalangium sp. s54d21]MDY7226038.1 alpha/beta hydrolase family protein [Hyalangium sp. s54d21]